MYIPPKVTIFVVSATVAVLAALLRSQKLFSCGGLVETSENSFGVLLSRD